MSVWEKHLKKGGFFKKGGSRTLSRMGILKLILICNLISAVSYGDATALESSQSLKDKPDLYWKKKLNPKQYDVCRMKGSERPFSGQYYKYNRSGIYSCVCCGQPIFDGSAKFYSNTGWASFKKPIKKEAVELIPDDTLFTSRTEVRCSHCGAHLGFAYDDGPPPERKRYRIDSVCLHFDAKPKP